MKYISVLEPRKFDAELSAVPVKRLNLSIIFLIGDIQVSFTSYILQNSPVVGFRNNVHEICLTSYKLINVTGRIQSFSDRSELAMVAQLPRHLF